MYKVLWVLSLITFILGIIFQIYYYVIKGKADKNNGKIKTSGKFYELSKGLRTNIIIVSFILSFMAFVLSFYDYRDTVKNPKVDNIETSVISEEDFNNSLKDMIYTMTMFPNSYIKWDNPNKNNSMVMILDIIAIEASYPRVCLTAPDGKMYDFSNVSNIEYITIDGTENAIIKIKSDMLNVRGL